MELISEEGLKRTFLGGDEKTWYEQHAIIRGQSVSWVESKDEDIERAQREFAEKGARANLMAYWALNDEFEPFGEVTVSWSDVEVVWTEGVFDEDGEPIPYFDPWWMKRCVAEQAYWPPAPVDPDPNSLPKPSKRDIPRGPRT